MLKGHPFELVFAGAGLHSLLDRTANAVAEFISHLNEL